MLPLIVYRVSFWNALKHDAICVKYAVESMTLSNTPAVLCQNDVSLMISHFLFESFCYSLAKECFLVTQVAYIIRNR